MNVRQAIQRPLLAVAAIAAILGAVPIASAQPYPPPPPPGWVGPNYYYGGHHWHRRAWVWDRFHHHRFYRYY